MEQYKQVMIERFHIGKGYLLQAAGQSGFGGVRCAA
jgi:hypothetical protein